MNFYSSFRSYLVFFCVVSLMYVFYGCGSSEDATYEDEMITDTGTGDESYSENDTAATEETQNTDEQTATEEQTNPEQQETQQPDTAGPIAMEQPEGPSKEQLQNELDSLKTENMQLKDQMMSSEQSGKDMAAKISDLEAANAALKKQMNQRPAVNQMPTHSMSPSPGKSSPQEIQMYESAVSSFQTKNYNNAISELQTLLNTGIKDDYADNCHYWIGVSYYQSKDFSSALQHFQNVMNYRFSEKKDDAQIMIAQCYERQGDRTQSQSEYRKLIEMFPTSEYVARAKSRLH